MDKIVKRIKFGVETDRDLILSTCNIPFGNRTGALLNVYNSEANVVNPKFQNLPTIPGLMVFDLVPTIGRTNKSLNTYMGKLYARLIRKISGAKDIEKCDQFMYIEIGKTCVDMVCKLKTAYQLAFTYREYNLYWPKAMLRAMGFNADDIAANLEDFRAWINRFISRIRSFNFPNIAYLKSGWDYIRTILIDSPDVTRAQAYIFNARFGYVWDPITDPNGTRLVITDLGKYITNWSFNTIRINYEAIVDSFAYDQDFIDISAWYDHLFEGNPEGLLKFTDCAEKDDDLVQIVYDPEALSVVENIELLPKAGNEGNTFNIYQLSNTIEQNMAFDLSAVGSAEEKTNISYIRPHIVMCHKSKPVNKDVCKYLTFKYEYDVYSAGKDGGFPISAAIFVHSTNDYCVYEAGVIQIDASGNYAHYDYGNYMASNSNGTNDDVFLQFSNRPFTINTKYAISSGTYQYVSGTSYVVYHTKSDFDNYVEITNNILRNYHGAVWFTNLEDQ